MPRWYSSAQGIHFVMFERTASHAVAADYFMGRTVHATGPIPRRMNGCGFRDQASPSTPMNCRCNSPFFRTKNNVIIPSHHYAIFSNACQKYQTQKTNLFSQLLLVGFHQTPCSFLISDIKIESQSLHIIFSQCLAATRIVS